MRRAFAVAFRLALTTFSTVDDGSNPNRYQQQMVAAVTIPRGS